MQEVGGQLKEKLRATAGRVSMTLNVGRRWSKPTLQPKDPRPLDAVPLYALVPSWHEADVIGSTVSNLIVQGCARVFLVDNGSLDGTALEAKQAGAEIARVYHTDFWDEKRKESEINTAIEEVSTASTHEHVWWLLCDADEFHHGPRGLTVAQYLEGLDRRFRVVGARCFNHFPSGSPAHVHGHHPLDYQPLCEEVRLAWCSLRHWKHPLIRWDRGGARIWPRVGYHRVSSPIQVIEPTEGVYLHHFPFRVREITTSRAHQLFEGGSDGRLGRAASLADLPDVRRRRYETLAHVYASEWAYVPRPTPGGQRRGVHPRPWEDQVSPIDAAVARWYSER